MLTPTSPTTVALVPIDFSLGSAIFALWLVGWLLRLLSPALKDLPMKKPASLFPAFERLALPVLPARARSLVWPNC
jgi:hypothetical protein